MGFTVMSVLSVCEFAMIFVIKYFVDRDRKRAATVESEVGRREFDEAQPVAQEKVGTGESAS
jgi:ACS family pantothenate transporter-like MFS transporter